MGNGSGRFLDRARVKPTLLKDDSVVGSKHGGGGGRRDEAGGPFGVVRMLG